MLSPAENIPSRYQGVRDLSLSLCEPLEYDDHLIQSAEFVSPPKWHLAHTTWFFETFLLARFKKGYKVFHPSYAYLFNSYYETVGDFHSRSHRGNLSRPTLREVRAYRSHVDTHMNEWLDVGAVSSDALMLLEIGLNHEEQHQELLLMDIKHILSSNPLLPAYRKHSPRGTEQSIAPVSYQAVPGGLYEIGDEGNGFAYDNERPRHKVFLNEFEIADRLVTCGEYMEFMADGGYDRPELWLSDGWDEKKAQIWQSPAYWSERERRWWLMTLGGVKEVDPTEPVCHVSYYEADAFARWAGKRLPSEQEWEVAARRYSIQGNFLENQLFHPTPSSGDGNPSNQFFGDLWEWTQSAYSPYPGYRAYEGALGEYNGKFMCNQFTLRGGACVTPRAHVRVTYRNFYHPAMRWQFSGIRLANSH